MLAILLKKIFSYVPMSPYALWQPRGIGWGGRWKGSDICILMIHVVVWQKPTQHHKAIILELKKQKTPAHKKNSNQGISKGVR